LFLLLFKVKVWRNHGGMKLMLLMKNRKLLLLRLLLTSADLGLLIAIIVVDHRLNRYLRGAIIIDDSNKTTLLAKVMKLRRQRHLAQVLRAVGRPSAIFRLMMMQA
jgi:hypothetical protein